MVMIGPGTDFVNRRVIVVEGPLAFRMRRFQAAQDGDLGLEVLTIPQLAARLAGGFSRPADEEVLYPAISMALAEDGLTVLAPVAALPGMVRAVTRTLWRVWRADFNLDAAADQSPRFRDLALIQNRVRATLPPGALIPTDLRDAAIDRIAHAKALLGGVHIEGVSDIDLVWRPLFVRLGKELNISWRAVGSADRAWFSGTVEATPQTSPKTLTGELAADPRAEVVEALRWARGLLSRGDVLASDIALTAAAPNAWDDHFLVLAAEAGLPVHFSHGVPALSTQDGQACAALADVLIKGLSQDRVRRLINRLPSDVRNQIPSDWSIGLSRRAGLFTVEHWSRALAATKDRRASGDAAEAALIPVLSLLANGVQAAEAAGDLLRGSALRLWRSALRAAPAAAIAFSLETLRVRDERDPGNSIVWAPAAHLAAAPRRHVRLLGLAGRAWPRAESEDALLPSHLLPRRQIQPVSDTEHDRSCFEILLCHSDGEVVLSRSRRSSEGSLLAQSSLWPRELKPLIQNRSRIPEHAFSESDRLLARPEEAGQSALVVSSRACWRNRSRREFTPHDGAIRPEHPAIERALAGVHSTTSLKRLLRDPLGFVWQHGLGWRAVELAQQPLALGARAFGELVHELMRRAVDSLEPQPGYVRASRDQVELALEAAVEHVAEAWPLERAVPPRLLWRHTMNEAARRCLRGLLGDEGFLAGTRSWTELGFGRNEADAREAPWDVTETVIIEGTELQLSGRLDRIDVVASGDAARISDYKTGAAPNAADRIVIGGGAEVQRVLYAMATRCLLPDLRTVISRLVYLDGVSAPFSLRGDTLDSAMKDMSHYLNMACAQLRAGRACMGPDARDKFSDLRLALPSDIEGYSIAKRAAFAACNRDLSALWSLA
jgi:PD-(D/E)XK nuclease superfamily